MYKGKVTNNFWHQFPTEITEGPRRQKPNGFIQSSGLFLQMSIRNKRDLLLRVDLTWPLSVAFNYRQPFRVPLNDQCWWTVWCYKPLRSSRCSKTWLPVSQDCWTVFLDFQLLPPVTSSLNSYSDYLASCEHNCRIRAEGLRDTAQGTGPHTSTWKLPTLECIQTPETALEVKE